MNPCVFIIFPLLLLLLRTTTANQLVDVRGGGEDDNGDVNKFLDKERNALLLFKAHLQDPNGLLSTWRAGEDDCFKWRGVTCNSQTGHVTQLDIQFSDLVGEINHSLLSLSYLTHLDVSYNNLYGTIPTFISTMTRLQYLNLGSNFFNGTIPWSIGSLTELRTLDLSYNSLYGTIPRSIGSLTKLRYLELDGNLLNGTIPKSIGSLKNLMNLDLSYNSLYGTIPSEFGNLTNLQVLNLGSVGRCRVENMEWLSHLFHLGELVMDGISLAKANHWVDAIVSLRKLYSLSLQGCELSHVMYPSSSFANSSSSIEFLYLGYNNINSSMYHWLFPLTSNSLSSLDLSSNMLDKIPKFLSNLCSLTYLNIKNNSVVVEFRVFLNSLSGCTSHTLMMLDASYSQFIGPFSDEIGTLKNLTYLVMNSCKLGPRFPKWIQTLKNLPYLDIADNKISDTIPLDFWDVSSFQLSHLNLSSNNISGLVLDLSSNFDKYSVIDLSSNRFHGPILNVSSTLVSLNLSRNKFNGGISFLCQIVDGLLEFLDLSDNLLSGQIPNCLWHFKALKVLNLGNNNLFGRLPTSIGSLIQLEVLYLYKNYFSGELPFSLKNCSNLTLVDLGDNKFFGNVPIWIGENLSRLYALILGSNNFFGTIPLQLCELANLQILDLSMNNLHGTIPSCLNNLTSMVEGGYDENVHFFSIPKYDTRYDLLKDYVDHAMIMWHGDEQEFFGNLGLLMMIDLSSNNLTGQIPFEITNLYELISLNLSKNALLGEIPRNIGQMKKLVTLDLSRNNFSGAIPSSMSQMTFLSDLDVSCNNLSGRIPSSTQLQTFEPSRYNGNAGLCRPPLAKKCLGDEETGVPAVVGKTRAMGKALMNFRDGSILVWAQVLLPGFG